MDLRKQETDTWTGGVGGRRRWRTMRWIVILFGLAVGPLGAVSILLVVLHRHLEVTRSLRWINLALGLWLLAAPWLLGGYPADATTNSLAAGALLAALSLVRGELRETYGGGWPAVWRSRSRP